MEIKYLLILIPLALSLFYGLRAVRVFGYPNKGQQLPELNKSWYIHQFWFNFAGSLAGWFFLVLFGWILDDIRDPSEITVAHIIIFLIGLLGVVGLLPSLLAQVPNLLHFLTRQTTESFYRRQETKTDHQ